MGNLRYIDQTNPQDAFDVGKIGTDSAQLNKYIKNLSKVHQTSQLDGPDSDGCSSEFLVFPPQEAHLLNCGLVIWHVDDLPGGPVGANFCHTSNGIRLTSV